MIRILTVDDHEVVRSGYRRLFESTGLYEIVGEASAGEEAVSLFKSLSPGIVVLDVMMPGIGVADIIQRIRNHQKDAAILVVTLYDHPSLVERCFTAGAYGYVTKSSSGAVLLEALSKVTNKIHFISPDISKVIAINQLNSDSVSSLSRLTPREFDVFLRIAKGQSVQTISDEMHLTKKTRSNYSSKIKKSLDATTTAKFVHVAIEEGLFSCDFVRGLEK